MVADKKVSPGGQRRLCQVKTPLLRGGEEELRKVIYFQVLCPIPVCLTQDRATGPLYYK